MNCNNWGILWRVVQTRPWRGDVSTDKTGPLCHCSHSARRYWQRPVRDRQTAFCAYMHFARSQRLDLNQGAGRHEAHKCMNEDEAYAPRTFDFRGDKLTAIAQAREGRLQDTLRNCRDGSPAQLRALAELRTTLDKISWLQAKGLCTKTGRQTWPA